MIDSLLQLYRTRFSFDAFYEILLDNIRAFPQHYIPDSNFLPGYSQVTANLLSARKTVLTQKGDIRVDLPVWFGNPSAKRKIVILGMEPRDTDKSGGLNIERVGRYVFGTPFALERPKGPYHSAFKALFTNEDCFVYFTDVVKTYYVTSGEKQTDDHLARTRFADRAVEGQPFLIRELEIINPERVVALGNESFAMLDKLLGGKYHLTKIRHPANGGARIAREQLKVLVEA